LPVPQDAHPHQKDLLELRIEIKLDRRQPLQPGAVGHFGDGAAIGLLSVAYPTHLVITEEVELAILHFGTQLWVVSGDFQNLDPIRFRRDFKHLCRSGDCKG
jgi:hypothetical protein